MANPLAPQTPAGTAPAPDLPSDLKRSLRSGRSLLNVGFTVVALGMAVCSLLPLVSLVAMVASRGLTEFRPSLFLELPPAAGMAGGGIGNALAGSLIMVTIASAISIPIGILAAIFLTEFAAPQSRLAALTRFAAKVLSGMPSILAGVFAYTVVVLSMGEFSAWAGGLALSILMIPTILLTASDAILGVPQKVREAAYGMGATTFQAVTRVILPTARPVLLTGILLAVARAAGETAPLLFTALFFDYWPKAPFNEPTASLPVLIYNFSGVPYPEQINMAWAASLVLILVVLVANITSQVIFSRSSTHR